MIEQEKISVVLQDDSVVIVSIVLNDYNGIERVFSNQVVENELTKMNLNAKSWRVLTQDDDITDRTFRNAWRDNGLIHVNMPLAREIHKNNLRLNRARYLEQLDVDYMKADEAGNSLEKIRITQKKQLFRDVTVRPEIASASTPQQLKSLTIEFLCGL